MKLTARQQQIVELIEEAIDDTGLPPTRAEIATALGFKSVNAVQEHLRLLAQKGAIELIPGTSRGLRLVHRRPTGIPLVGQVAAGNPILAEENIEDHLDLPASLFQARPDYVLKVRGDSMRDAGILDGDLLAVKKVTRAEDGDIIVARIDDDVTVKTLKRGDQPGILQLLPENPDYTPIVVDLAKVQFAIEGLAVGVIRTRL
ncbi:MAG: transcriptional repressor LexA [Porticoccaceae bacterium]